MSVMVGYLVRVLAPCMGLALLALLALDFVSEIIDQGTALKADYTFIEAIRYSLAELPAAALRLLPVAICTGAMLGLGLLAAGNEIVAMRACGLATWRIVAAAMAPLLVLAVVALALAEFVAPGLEADARSRRALLRAAGEQPEQAGGGIWLHHGRHYVHITELADGRATELRRWRTGPQGLQSAQRARRATAEAGGQWRVQGLQSSHFAAPGQPLRQSAAAAGRWHLQLPDDALASPDAAQSLRALGAMTGSRPAMLFWGLLATPLLAAALLLLAVALSLGRLAVATTGARLFCGILLAALFQLATNIIHPAALIYGWPPALAALSMPSLAAALALWMLWRDSPAPLWHRLRRQPA